jgi:hypothetical protein
MTDIASPLAASIRSFLETLATPAAAAEDRDGTLYHALRLCPGLLTKAFNAAAVPDDPHVRPALVFAEENGLSGIGRTYALPPGLDAETIEAYVLALRWTARAGLMTPQRYAERMQELGAALEEINPALAALAYDRTEAPAVFDVVMGVTSGFNTDDIQFFIDGNYFARAIADRAYADKYRRAEEGHSRIGWVPSPKTLDRIIAQRRL